MRHLVTVNTAGQVTAGSHEALLERAGAGDDLTIYVESLGYDEFIIFGNYAVLGERVAGLSLLHLDHGDLSDPTRLRREPIATVQYIYDSMANNVIGKDLLDDGETRTTAFIHNAAYRSYAWFSTRRFAEADSTDRDSLIGGGDQFKARLDIAEGCWLVFKPDIIYFPDDGRDWLVKSSAMLLPAEFITEPAAYARSGRPFVESRAWHLAYLNIDAGGRLTIAHRQHFALDASAGGSVREGALARGGEGRWTVTRLHCEHRILIPCA